jgi:hypothetical protein
MDHCLRQAPAGCGTPEYMVALFLVRGHTSLMSGQQIIVEAA